MLSDFLQWYINILGSQIHVYSMLAVTYCILTTTFTQENHPLHIRLANSMFVVCLGHFIYEDIFILIMGSVGRSIDAWALYILITIGILAGMIIYNKEYPSFEADNDMFVLVFVLLGIFAVMFYQGWFHDLQVWYLGKGPDPHNGLWAFSKLLGFFIPHTLLRRDIMKTWKVGRWEI